MNRSTHGGNGWLSHTRIMSIKNWKFHNLYMDFSSMYADNRHPSDIDMLYVGRNKTLIIGEIKNERGVLKDGQRRLLVTLAENWKHDAVCLYIVHNKYYQYGDREVNVAECYVQEIYHKKEHRWRPPKRPTTVKEIIDYYK